jgi:hypothetical protein
MILGEMQMVSGPYGPESACVPYDGQELEALLTEAYRTSPGKSPSMKWMSSPTMKKTTPSPQTHQFAISAIP